MFSENFQYFLTKSIIPHIRAKYPFRHRLFMDNSPKHTSESTTHFMQINNINHFPTPVSKLVFFNIVDNNINHYHKPTPRESGSFAHRTCNCILRANNRSLNTIFLTNLMLVKFFLYKPIKQEIFLMENFNK